MRILYIIWADTEDVCRLRSKTDSKRNRLLSQMKNFTKSEQFYGWLISNLSTIVLNSETENLGLGTSTRNKIDVDVNTWILPSLGHDRQHFRNIDIIRKAEKIVYMCKDRLIRENEL